MQGRLLALGSVALAGAIMASVAIGASNALAAPPPVPATVTSVVPNSGPMAGGTSVTINYTCGTGINSYVFGRSGTVITGSVIPCSPYGYNSLTVQTPAVQRVGTVDVYLGSCRGSIPTSCVWSPKTKADQYTYTG